MRLRGKFMGCEMVAFAIAGVVIADDITFCVISLVYGGQAMTYAVRDRQSLWGMHPTKWLVLSSIADMLFISVLANRGIQMSSLSLRLLSLEFLAAIAFYFVMNLVKIPVFRRLHIT